MSFWDEVLKTEPEKVSTVRAKGFATIFRLLEERNANLLIETGTTRDHNDWQGAGCMSYWMAKYVRHRGNGGAFVTVDNDERRLEVCRALIGDDRVHFVHSDSVAFLDRVSGGIDFLYLDSLDSDPGMEERAQRHQLDEVKAALPRLHQFSVIALDDNQPGGKGKCALSIPYLLEKGWELVEPGYTAVLVKKGVAPLAAPRELPGSAGPVPRSTMAGRRMKIRVLREAGGLGDLVRCLAPLIGLRKKYPGAQIDYWTIPLGAEITDRCGLADRIFKAPQIDPIRRRRLESPDPLRRPYLKSDSQYELTVDLYCPGFEHEKAHPRMFWRDRIELFCEAAGVAPEQPCIPISNSECDQARRILSDAGVAEGKGWIAIQPLAMMAPARDWPLPHWKQLAEMLMADGYGVFVLDSLSHVSQVGGFKCPKILSKPILQVAALLKVSRLLIGPDSGLAHLIGAVNGMALGLTALMSGAILYRHYPRHNYVHPETPGDSTKSLAICEWPCGWIQRPWMCHSHLRTPGATCAALATVRPVTVRDAAVRMCEDGDGPRLAVAPVPPAPAASAAWLRAVALALGHGTQVLDAGGLFSEACRDAGIPHNCVTVTSGGLPLPYPDRGLDNAVLAGNPADGFVRDWVWEIFRALRQNGRLYALPEYEPLLRKMGFTPAPGTPNAYAKATTWPQDQTER